MYVIFGIELIIIHKINRTCDVPRDDRLLSPCRWGIRSLVVAMLRLARPLGTFGRQGV